MKKALRISISLILFLPSFPVLALTFSGMGLLVVIAQTLTYPFHYFGNNKDGMSDCKESLIMATFFLWGPFICWFDYIQTGKFGTL